MGAACTPGSPVAEQKLVFAFRRCAVALQVVESPPLPVDGRTRLASDGPLTLPVILREVGQVFAPSCSNIKMRPIISGVVFLTLAASKARKKHFKQYFFLNKTKICVPLEKEETG